jgi:phosphopantothenoylcysteine decarboxylase/phosphopantothenate--cysteine ligase
VHPSKGIIGTKGDELKGRRIVLCVTGSVAAVRSPEIARELMRHGAEVYPVMTAIAQRIVHPNLLE